jgi:myo-inositol 2-dehydrogenase/D-chiro-inositol 1-dehydrogenase
MAPIRYGIIGCGMMGQEHLCNIDLTPNAEVAAIYEPDPSMVRISEILAPNAQFVGTLADLLEFPDLDCFLIASPNFCHAAQIIEIAQTRPLPLLVEKPLFTDHDDAERLKEVFRSYPNPIWVAMEYRFMPPISHFIDQAQEVTGGIQMLTIKEHRFPFLQKVMNWNRFNRFSGGTMVEKCCHFFDLMRLILKDEPVRVSASIGQAVNHLNEQYHGGTPDIDDHGYVIIDFQKGARAMLELCMFADGAKFQEEISAIGPQGKIEAFIPGPQRFWPAELGQAPEAVIVKSPRTKTGYSAQTIPVPKDILSAGDHNGATYYQHLGFQALLREEISAPKVSARDGLASVLMGQAAQKAAQEGAVIRLSPSDWLRA